MDGLCLLLLDAILCDDNFPPIEGWCLNVFVLLNVDPNGLDVFGTLKFEWLEWLPWYILPWFRGGGDIKLFPCKIISWLFPNILPKFIEVKILEFGADKTCSLVFFFCLNVFWGFDSLLLELFLYDVIGGLGSCWGVGDTCWGVNWDGAIEFSYGL